MENNCIFPEILPNVIWTANMAHLVSVWLALNKNIDFFFLELIIQVI